MSADRLLRIAARSLSRAGLVHAYGHCSTRTSADVLRVCPAMPMGLIPQGTNGTDVPVEGALPEGVLGEVRLHQEIYRRDTDIGGVVRFMGPSLMALGALGLAPALRHGFGCYFYPGAGFWGDPQLIRDGDRARGVIDAMGESAGVVMRGNGAVVRASSLERAVVLAWYLEDAARVELAALASGLADSAPVISVEEARQRATDQGGIFERMWEHLTHADPES
jgi:HCOMODA/2-hydroxy-3-carboxy-muconic semialdehyde decarboxylase